MISNGLCNFTGTAAEYRARACETLKSKWQWRIIFSFLKRFIYFKGKKWNKIIIAKLYYQTILLLNLSTGYLTCTLKLSLTTTCFEEIRTNGVLVLLSDLNSIWFKKTYKIIYDKNFVEDFLDQYDNKFGDLEQGVLALIIRCSN